MTEAIKTLVEWQAGKPKREWMINSSWNGQVAMILQEEGWFIRRAITSVALEHCNADALNAEVLLAIEELRKAREV